MGISAFALGQETPTNRPAGKSPTVDRAGAPQRAAPDAPAPPGRPDPASDGSLEVRRFSAGIRAIVALLCCLLIGIDEPPAGALTLSVLLAYVLWAGYLVRAEAANRPVRPRLLLFWIDVAWSAAVAHLSPEATMMMTLTLVQPVVLTSIGMGVRHGVVLAVFAAGGMLINSVSLFIANDPLHWRAFVPAGAVLGLVPVAALLSRPMSVLRQRLQIMRGIEERLDPRRGLEVMASTLVDALRTGLQADVVGLLLPSASGAPGCVSSAQDGVFRLRPQAQREIEALLVHSPDGPCSHVVRSWLGLRGGTTLHGLGTPSAALKASLEGLAALLEVSMLVVIPLTRYERRHGHLVVGLHGARSRLREVTALAEAAPELFRLIEQASLVDKLQEEGTAHERMRIGRDLHDSAIQPYVGLMYAIEGVCQRVAADNPARAELESLRRLANGEVEALRELISGLRKGGTGDDALMPALRRQVQRFSLLFGIDVQLQGHDTLRSSRSLAGSLFHMINEALNNIRKHSPARHVTVRIEQQPGQVTLTVDDDAGTVLGRPQERFRPVSLSERVEVLGGTLTISRTDGLNTRLTIVMPEGDIRQEESTA